MAKPVDLHNPLENVQDYLWVDLEDHYQKLKEKLDLLARVRNARLSYLRALEHKSPSMEDSYLDFARRKNDYVRWCLNNGENPGF